MPVVELVTDPKALDDLAADWRRLAAARGNAFLTPEWFFASLRHGGEAWSPLVAVARDTDGTTRGLLPFASRNRGRRRELVLGGPIRCDHLSPVALEADDESLAAEVAPALVAEFGRLPTLKLGNVDPQAGWWRTLAQGSPTPAVCTCGPEDVLPYIDLRDTSWDEYLAARSSKLRSQIRRLGRKLAREHELAFRLTSSVEELEGGDLEAFFQLHDARWDQRAAPSSLADPRLRSFHAEFAAAALARGWLRLLLMEIDGKPAAAWYGWRLGNRWSQYQLGFDPAWHRYGPGILAIAEAIKLAIGEGAAECDLLLGAETYKDRLTEHSRRAAETTVVAQRGPARVRAEAESRIRRAWRRLPESRRAPALELRARLRRLRRRL